MSFLIGRVLERFDAFTARLEQARSMPQPNRVTYLKNLESPKKAIPLFGSDPEDPFGFGYSRSIPAPVMGAINPNAPRYERENLDGEIDLEKWKPNLDIPSLVSHGKALNYEHVSDQKPIVSFQGEIGEKWDGQIRNVPKTDFQAVRGGHDKTEGDRQAEDLKNYPFDFTF